MTASACVRPSLPFKKGTAGVLAGGGRLCTGGKTGFHQTARHRTAAVAGKLHHILAGIAVGRTEKQSHALVKGLFPVHEMPEQCGVALSLFHLFLPGLPGGTPGQPRHSSLRRTGAPQQCRPPRGALRWRQWSIPAYCILSAHASCGCAVLVRPVRQTCRSAHFLILQFILPRFCAKRYTRRAVFPHLPKCLWKKGLKMVGDGETFCLPAACRDAPLGQRQEGCSDSPLPTSGLHPPRTGQGLLALDKPKEEVEAQKASRCASRRYRFNAFFASPFIAPSRCATALPRGSERSSCHSRYDPP